MANIIFWEPNDFREPLYSRAFEVADYEFDIGFPFFKMADPISWKQNIEICLVSSKFCAWMFLRSLFMIRTFYAQQNLNIMRT